MQGKLKEAHALVRDLVRDITRKHEAHAEMESFASQGDQLSKAGFNKISQGLQAKNQTW